jgi:hypothetical protein
MALGLPACFPSLILECTLLLPELDAVVARRKLGFINRITLSGSDILLAAYSYDQRFIVGGLYSSLAVFLSKYGLSLEDDSQSSILFCKDEILERSLLRKRAALVTLRSLSGSIYSILYRI